MILIVLFSNPLNMSFHCLLTCIFLRRILLFNEALLISISCFVFFPLWLLLLIFFSLMIGLQQFGYDVPWCDFFVFILLQICWAFGSVIVHFINKFGKKLVMLSSDVYLLSLSSRICLAYSSQFFAGLMEL